MPPTVLANNQYVYGVFTNGYYINFATDQQGSERRPSESQCPGGYPAGMTMGGTLNVASADASNRLSMTASCETTDQVSDLKLCSGRDGDPSGWQWRFR